MRAHLLTLVAAIAIPLAAVVGYSVYIETRNAIAEASAGVQALATVIAANTNRTLTNNRERLEILAQRPRMRVVDEKRCDPILADFRELFPRVANLTSIDLTGRAVCSAVPQPGGKPVNVFKTEWFQRALAEKRFLAGNPFRGPITGKWVSVLMSPIHDEQKELVGFMGLPLDLDDFDPNITGVSIPAGSRYGILGSDGTLIWRNVDPEQDIGTNRGESVAVRRLLALKEGVIDELGIDGVRRYFAVAPIAETNWYAYAGVPHAAVHAAVNSSVMRGSALGLSGLLAVAALAFFLALRIENPIRALVTAARAVKHGDLDARAEVKGPHEVAEVASEFNAMMDAWSFSTRQLRASEERFRTVADYAGDWEYWQAPGHEILYMSPSCESVTGHAREQFLSDPDLLDRVVHPDDRVAWQTHHCNVDGNPAAGELDFRIVRRDGDSRWIAHHCIPVRGDQGEYKGRRVTNRDITERKQAEKEREEYLTFFTTSADLMGIADPNGSFKKINPAFSQMLGYTEAEILARPFIDFVHPDDRQPTLDEMARQLELGFSLDFENRYVCKDGSSRWLSWRAKVSPAEGLTYATARDITERKQLDSRLARLSDLYATLGEINEAIVRIRNRDTLLQEVCRIVVEHGHFAAAWVGMADSTGWFRVVAKEGGGAGYFDRIAVSTDATRPEGQGPGGCAFRERRHVICNDFLHAEAAHPWLDAATREDFRAAAAFPLWHAGEVIAVLGLYATAEGFFDEELSTLILRLTEDVSLALDNMALDAERKRMEETLREMATTDALTGLPNRRHFLDRMENQLARVQRQVTRSAAVLMLDLDHFKQVNDIHGHAIGDAVLRHFATLIRDDLRKIDMVGRLGGEEFGIVLPGADPAAALSFAERLCRKVADSPLMQDGRTIPVTVSIGIAAIGAGDATADAALIRADKALYRAKESGRNRVIIADGADLRT